MKKLYQINEKTWINPEQICSAELKPYQYGGRLFFFIQFSLTNGHEARSRLFETKEKAEEWFRAFLFYLETFSEAKRNLNR